jgi:hypothetical protein
MVDKKPVRYVFRAMRVDGDDLRNQDSHVRVIEPDGDQMRIEVIRSVAKGSIIRSPFLHVSTSLMAAHHFHVRAQSTHAELEENQVLVKIDLWAWYQQCEVTMDMIIDLSTHEARKHYFEKGTDAYGSYVEDHFHDMIKYSEKMKEVLLKWRGNIPLEYFQVVDDCGHYIDEYTTLLAKARGTQPRSSSILSPTPDQPQIRAKARPRHREVIAPVVGASVSSGVGDAVPCQAKSVIPPMPRRPPPCPSQASPANPLPMSSVYNNSINVNIASSDIGKEECVLETIPLLADGLPNPKSMPKSLHPRNDALFVEPAPKCAKASGVVANPLIARLTAKTPTVLAPPLDAATRCPPPMVMSLDPSLSRHAWPRSVVRSVKNFMDSDTESEMTVLDPSDTEVEIAEKEVTEEKFDPPDIDEKVAPLVTEVKVDTVSSQDASLNAEEVRTFNALIQSSKNAWWERLKVEESEEMYNMLVAVAMLEEEFVLNSKTCFFELFLAPSEKNVYDDRSSAPKGFDPVVQDKRRQKRADVLDSEEFVAFRIRREELSAALCTGLMKAGVTTIEGAWYLSDYSKKAMLIREYHQAVGSQPCSSQSSAYLHHMSYKHLLQTAKIIMVRPGHSGRKPGASCQESPFTDIEESVDYDFGQWWMDLGGFSSPNERDAENWSPLHHALDALTYCKRAGRAALWLIPRSSPITINSTTIGQKPYNYSCLHFICDGSSKEYLNARIVQELIDKRANIEAKANNNSTPLMLASATGIADVVKCLVCNRADLSERNANRKGVLQLAAYASSTTASSLSQSGAPFSNVFTRRPYRTGHSDESILRRNGM